MPFLNDQIQANEETNLRLSGLQTRFTFKTEEVMAHLRENIYGQEHVLSQIEAMLRIIKADISDPYRPLHVALFLGPTGVGKTETVRKLAEKIHGDPDHFCRVDMNTLSQEHYAAALTGAPPGYVGSQEGTSLFQEDLIKGSFSKPGIMLFDELEKASEPVIQALLNVFDNGTLVLANGKQRIDFRNTLIFMTSNIGSREMQQFASPTFSTHLKRIKLQLKRENRGVEEDVLLKQVIQRSLEKEFPPEFINRIDDILNFQWLKDNALDEVLDILLAQFNKRLKQKGFTLIVSNPVKKFLIKEGFEQKYGARSLRRSLRKHLEVPVAMAMSSQPQSEGTTLLYAVLHDGEIKVGIRKGGA